MSKPFGARNLRPRPDKGIAGRRDTTRPLFEMVWNGHTSMCWMWSRYIDKITGYGQLTRMSKTINAHVWLYRMACGDVPTGLQLDHLCRNRACVRPDHLEPVTGRVNVNRGAKTKVTLGDIEMMRQMRANGLGRAEVAAKFGIHTVYVSALLKGVRNEN